MATTGNFPTSHSTTTTTTTRVVIAPCQFDPAYVKTLPGILKLCQMVIDFIGFIIVMSTYYTKYTDWYGFVSMTGFIVTTILVVLYLFHLIERSYMLPWLLMEFIYCGFWSFFFLIAACLIAAGSYGHGPLVAGCIFGFIGMILYGYDAYIKYRGWRAGDIAQGERHVTTTSGSGTSPTAY